MATITEIERAIDDARLQIAKHQKLFYDFYKDALTAKIKNNEHNCPTDCPIYKGHQNYLRGKNFCFADAHPQCKNTQDGRCWTIDKLIMTNDEYLQSKADCEKTLLGSLLKIRGGLKDWTTDCGNIGYMDVIKQHKPQTLFVEVSILDEVQNKQIVIVANEIKRVVGMFGSFGAATPHFNLHITDKGLKEIFEYLKKGQYLAQESDFDIWLYVWTGIPTSKPIQPLKWIGTQASFVSCVAALFDYEESDYKGKVSKKWENCSELFTIQGKSKGSDTLRKAASKQKGKNDPKKGIYGDVRKYANSYPKET